MVVRLDQVQGPGGVSDRVREVTGEERQAGTLHRELNGQREIGTIDLTSKKMFDSPFYRLQQNDVVLVEQTRRKLKQQDQQALLQQIGLFTSIAAAAALILNIIK